jgi:glucose/arabinose dehydrogenase
MDLRPPGFPTATFLLLACATASAAPAAPPSRQRCAPGNAGLTLPFGFCATLFAENVGAVRHLTVAPNGDVFVAVEGRGGGVLALRDTNGDGRADLTRRFGPGGGTGIALDSAHLYFATASKVIRWRWKPSQLEPDDASETIVTGLPTGGHRAKTILLAPGNRLYVNLGSASNSCQERDRSPHSPGKDPCPELDTRAGIWQFAADRVGQREADGVRIATGLRNAMALALQPGTGALFAATHGRDQLGENWGYSDELNAELPAEEFVQLERGDHFGWPYCYYDPLQGLKVVAPEYGGDGKTVGRCAAAKKPLLGFPAHWAPMALAFYAASQFPPAYRDGVFIAFHGSWNRAPLPQAGFRVVFIPFVRNRPAGGYSTFAADAGSPTGLRASGVAVGSDGSVYISADGNGKIWKVMASN